MNTLILSLLRHDATSWWYHRKLREMGDVDEAKARERASIRSSCQLLRLTVEEHSHRNAVVFFDRALNPPNSTMCASGIHPGEWAAFHLIHGWMDCFEPIRNFPNVPKDRPRYQRT